MRELKVFSVFYFSYLVVVLYSVTSKYLRVRIYGNGFSWAIFLSSMGISILFFFVFFLGYVLLDKQPSRILLSIAFLLLSFSQGIEGFIVALFVLLAIAFVRISLIEFSKVFLIVSFLSLLILYLKVGVPLFCPALRLRLVGPLVVTAYSVTLGITYLPWDIKKKLPLFVLFSFLFYLSSFKSLSIFVLLPLFLAILDGSILLSVPLFILLLSIFYSHFPERVGFTFLTFENLVKLSFPWGIFHGKLLMSPNPRWLVARLFGFVCERVHYTYFFFGQAIADFGLLGVFEAFVLGYLLKVSEGRKSGLFVLSVYVYSLDPGIDSLALLFVLGVLLVEYQNSTLGKYLYPPKGHQ